MSKSRPILITLATAIVAMVVCSSFGSLWQGETARAGGDPNCNRPQPQIPYISGRVTAIDNKSITVQGFSVLIGVDGRSQKVMRGRREFEVWSGDPIRYYFTHMLACEFKCSQLENAGDTLTVTSIDGKTVTIMRWKDQPPRRFVAIGDLAKGSYNRWANGRRTDAGFTYRLGDVLVGDHVNVHCQGPLVNACAAICILRRPGGMIPPAPGQNPNAIRKHHEHMQALQDWEEKGTPIPDKYHPGGGQTGIAPPPHEPGLHIPG